MAERTTGNTRRWLAIVVAVSAAIGTGEAGIIVGSVAAELPPAPSFKSGRLVRGADGRVVLDNAAIRVCPPDAKTEKCFTTSIAKALAAVGNGQTIAIAAGQYAEAAVLTANGVTILAEPGAKMTGVAAEGKAALVIRGNDTVIDGLECGYIVVPDGNGACIRLEGSNLTLRNVHFHDSEQGILGGGGSGTVRIEDSVFERLGNAGQAHGMYLAGDALILRRSRVLAAKSEGHEIKSRAARTTIENNVIASLDGDDSRLIDIPNGGEIVIRNNILAQGPASENQDVIGIGLEGPTHLNNTTLIEDNIILLERPAGNVMLNIRQDERPVVRNNLIVGGPPYEQGGNTWYPDRVAAKLPPYPAVDFPRKWAGQKPAVDTPRQP